MTVLGYKDIFVREPCFLLAENKAAQRNGVGMSTKDLNHESELWKSKAGVLVYQI